MSRITLIIFDMLLIRALVLAFMLSLALSLVASLDWNKGLNAFNSSDRATAPQVRRPLAEQGDVEAQTKLLIIYENGYGSPKIFQKP